MRRIFKSPKLRFVTATLFLALLCLFAAEFLAIVSALMLRSPLEGLENQLTDLSFQARDKNRFHEKVSPEEIVIIDVDEASIEKLGRTQMWPRSFDAGVISYIASGNPKSIAIDFLYTESDAFPDAYKDILEQSGFNQADSILKSLSTDTILSQSIGAAGNVYLSFFDDPVAKDSISEVTAFPGIRPIGNPDKLNYGLPELVHPVLPVPSFASGAKAVCSITMPTSLDGTVRNYPLLEKFDGRPDKNILAHFPVYLIADEFGIADSQIVYTPGNLSIGTQFDVPVRQDGSFRINWLGNSESIRYISYYKALREIAPSEFFENKYVFIGTSASGLEDLKTVPSRKTKMPGVEVHAIAFLNMINGAYITEISHLEAVPYFFLVSVVLVAIFLLLKPLIGFILAVLLIATEMFGFILWLLPEKSIFIPIVTLMLITFFSYLFASLYTYLIKEKKNRRLKYAFGSYVSPVVVEEIMKEASMLKLGGQKKMLTVLFSDIRGFTSYSENLDPEEIVAMLNKYLSRMSDVIFEQKGTIDKFIGDAIMAIFGAPIPAKDHADSACRTALRMISALEEFNTERLAEGKQPISIGIGLNTGEMTVGNIGSEKRFDYTVIGDAVNLGSRLEGLTKYFQTTIIVSEMTRDACVNPGDFLFRELAQVKVKGKINAVAIYELVAEAGVDNGYSQWLKLWEQALKEYKSRNFEKSIALFNECLKFFPSDGASAYYIQKAEKYMKSPESYSPIFEMDSK